MTSSLRARHRATAAVAVVSGALLLAGCSEPSVVVRPPTGGDEAQCAEVVDALPAEVSGLSRRDVTPVDTGRTAAWGDPAVVLRCGVPQPQGYVAGATLLSVDDIDWYPEQLERGIRYTTYALTTCVEVDVPEDYLAPAELLTSFTDALAAIPVGEGCGP